MEIRDLSGMMDRAQPLGEGATTTQLYPVGLNDGGLVAVDLWEVEPGGSTTLHSHAEEHVLFVISGNGELARSEEGGATALVRADTVVSIGPREAHLLRNTGSEKLRVLVSTPLLVRSERALGLPNVRQDSVRKQALASEPEAAAPSRKAPSSSREPVPLRPEAPAPEPSPMPAEEAAAETSQTESRGDAETPPSDISGLMKRGSDLVGAPKSERRKPAPPPPTEQPEPEQAQQPEQPEQPEDEEGEAEAESNLMELMVVFDGGSRGNPGEGYGTYLVQAPGRKPVIKRVELGDNYTTNQAEYDTLVECVKYIISRLEATGRTPQQVQLDIRTDSDPVVNQLLGNREVKDAGLRKRHAQTLEALEAFADWRIEWHPPEESARLLGH